MAAKKLSIALDEVTATAVAASARQEGLSLSAWLNRAAERALRIQDGLRAVAEWEATHGSITGGELEAAGAVLDGKPGSRAPRRRA